MKRISFLITAVFIAMTLATACAEGQQDTGTGTGVGRGAGNGQGRSAGGGRGAGGGQGYYAQGIGGGESDLQYQAELDALLDSIPAGAITESERATLIHMAEEEKLARDVYSRLFAVWNLPVFDNISKSEQQHLDSLTDMLKRYGIADAVSSLPAGSFVSAEMTDLYASLVKTGSESLGNALEVGATIEDLDIFDLLEAVDETDNDDLKVVYQNLMKGSRNHLRSFVGQLERQGADYDPEYISAAYYERILSLNREYALIDDPDYTL